MDKNMDCEDYENDTDSSSPSDSSSDDDSLSDNDDEITQKITQLEKQVTANPYSYDPHVELIKLLKKEGELEKLRDARERMSKIFPLTEELWLDWIRDEQKLATSEAERDVVSKLYERAIMDYISIEIWLEYVQFLIGRMDMKNGINNVRSVFEKAITAVGLHVSKGAIIWEAYREFENAILSTLQPHSEGDEGNVKDEAEQQHKRIWNIFKRQLSIPLLDMDKTYKEFLEWNKEKEADATIQLLYEKALSKLRKLESYEDELLSNDTSRMEIFEKYIEHETKEGEPARIQCVFERALVELCLIPNMWIRYTDYLEKTLKIDSISLPVFERAVRNCPWSVDLWQNYILAMERHHQPHEKTKELVDRALGAGFTVAAEFRQLWVTYLDYLRRRINWSQGHETELEELRATFLRAHNHLVEFFGNDADPTGIILRYWARIEARYCKNAEKMRELWDEVMLLGNNRKADFWLEYAALERLSGDSQHVRKLFQKSLQTVDDWPETVGEAWLNFEQDAGTLEQWEAARSKYNSRLSVVQERRNKEQEKSLSRQRREAEIKGEETHNTKFDRQSLKRKLLQRHPNAKRKRDEEPKVSSSVDKEGFKIPHVPSQGKWETISAPSPVTSSSPSSTSSENKGEKGISHGEKIAHDSSKDELTIFLSNLDYSVNEDDIRQMFSSIGEIQSLRLVRDYKGRSKGYCYVQYKTRECQQAALKKDRELLNERPVFVSPCEDKKTSSAQKKFKYKVGLEKNKLFVRGLPFSSTKEDVVTLFQPYGELKDVRIVTYRNGHSKGLAFVDFKDETSAAMALVKLDGTKIGNQTISVALSNPPDRGTPASGPQNIPTLGGGPKEVGKRGRGRTQVSLVPRSVNLQQSSGASSKATDSGSSVNGAQNGKVESTESVVAPKSNEDFRNMFLKK